MSLAAMSSPVLPSMWSPMPCRARQGAIKLKTKEMDKPRIGTDRYVPLEQVLLALPDRSDPGSDLHREALPHQGHVDPDRRYPAGARHGSRKWREALKKLDFVVAVDLFHTPTTQYADVVLPAGTFLEKDSLRSWWVPAAEHQQGHDRGRMPARTWRSTSSWPSGSIPSSTRRPSTTCSMISSNPRA